MRAGRILVNDKLNPVGNKKSKKKGITVSIAAGFLLALFIRNFLIFPHTLTTDYMSPSLPKGKTVYITPLARYSGLETGDIVLIKHPYNNTHFFSRVIGLPGDKISIKDKKILKNGRILHNFPKSNNILGSSFSTRDQLPDTYIKENTFFVLGDNWEKSPDSRTLGPVSAVNLAGKVIF